MPEHSTETRSSSEEIAKKKPGPVALSDPGIPPDSKTAPDKDQTTKPKRKILVVEDNDLDSELIGRFLLRDPNFSNQVFPLREASAALRLCQTTHVDCIILDLDLPGINGLEFLERLGRESEFLCWPVVVLTGEGTEEIAVEAMKAGAQDYLVKSQVTSERLLRSIQNAIERVSYIRRRETKITMLRKQNMEILRENEALKERLGDN